MQAYPEPHPTFILTTPDLHPPRPPPRAACAAPLPGWCKVPDTFPDPYIGGRQPGEWTGYEWVNRDPEWLAPDAVWWTQCGKDRQNFGAISCTNGQLVYPDACKLGIGRLPPSPPWAPATFILGAFVRPFSLLLLPAFSPT